MCRSKAFVVIAVSVLFAFAAAVVLRAEPRENAESAEEMFHAELLKLAAEYQEFGRVDDEERLAPIFCRAPRRAVLRLSKSDEADTHGRKLYYLYAKDRSAYLDIANAKAKTGQAIIKQSWHAETTAPARDEHADAPNSSKNASRYRAGKQGPLFIMYKTDPDTPETDNGWVYGTLSSDGKHVTSAGRVATCMACHQDAPHDRLFGLQQD